VNPNFPDGHLGWQLCAWGNPQEELSGEDYGNLLSCLTAHDDERVSPNVILA